MIYYVSSETGNDYGTGTAEFPLRTIQSAANLAQPGDSIYVLPGIYRERVSPPRGGTQGSPIIYKGIIDASGNRPIVRGSCIWRPTVNDLPYIWSDVLDPALFTDNSHIDGGCPFDVPFSVTPYGMNGLPEYNMGEPMTPTPDPSIAYCLGQVFVSASSDSSSTDAEQYVQMPRYKDMMQTEKSWYYNPVTRVLSIHLPHDTESVGQSMPQQGTRCSLVSLKYAIEITNQRRLFAPHIRKLKYITVTGFTFERCGNNYPNQFWLLPQNQQAGAVGTRSGKYWTIDNNVIRHATGIGIDWGNEGAAGQDLEVPCGTVNCTPGYTVSNGTAIESYGHTISNNLICDNGAAGTASYMCKKFTFVKNTVTRNNAYKFYGKRRWESAGLKVHCPTDAMILNNQIYDNYCHGIWCDQGISTATFDSNVLRGNQGSGLNVEIGKGTNGLVTNCEFDGNVCGITLVTAGGITIRNNRFIGSQQADIQTTLFNRPNDKWDSDNVRIMSNQFGSSSAQQSQAQPSQGQSSQAQSQAQPPQAQQSQAQQPQAQQQSPMFLVLTPKDVNIPANRYMDGNTYYCRPDEKKFTIGKTACVFEDWRTQWDMANGGVNCDANSRLI